jgi:hypothetical protein
MLVKFTPSEEVENDILHIQKRLGITTVSKTVQAVMSHYNQLLNDYQDKCKQHDETQELYDTLTNDVGVFLDSRKKLENHFSL